MVEQELAYKRKARLRGKHRKVRIEQVYDMLNLHIADREARKGKDGVNKYHKGVRLFDTKPEQFLNELHNQLKEMTYHTSEGHECERRCPCGKVRLLHKLPYYPDHIVHHALMQVIFPTLKKYYYYDSSASIKGRGTSYAQKRTARYIDENKWKGCLYYAKVDFVKFYHRIDQQKIYDHLCSIFGNKGIRYLLWEIVTACDEGLGIGLFPIQPLTNSYTSPLCRLLMALFDVRIEIHCDDMIIISDSAKEVWKAVNFIAWYSENVMEQEIHDGIGVQVIDIKNGLDYVGNVFYFNHTLVRKRLKGKFKRKMHRLKEPMHRYRVAASYKGWMMHCNGFNLWCKTMAMKSFKDLQVPKFEKLDADGKRMLDGTKVSASILTGREIVFLDSEFDVRSKFSKNGESKRSTLVQVEDNGRRFKFFTDNIKLKETLMYIREHDGFPFRGTLVNVNHGGGLPDYEIQ